MSATALPSLGLGVITYNSRRHIDRCLESLFHAVRDLPAIDVVVVDNASPDGTAEYVREKWGSAPLRLIARPDNVGYAGAVNTIARVVEGEVLAILNPDLELSPTGITTALQYLQAHPTVGMLGGNLLNAEGQSKVVYGALPTPFRLFYAFSGLRRIWANPIWDLGQGLRETETEPFAVGYPCGAFVFMPRSAWELVGPFDERFFLYFEETDWACRCHQAGLGVMIHPGIRTMHEGAGSSEKDLAAQKVIFGRFFKSGFQYLAKHYGVAAARNTFRWMWQSAEFKQFFLRFNLPESVQFSQAIVRAGLEANREFVLGPEISAEPQLILRPPSPVESLARSSANG